MKIVFEFEFAFLQAAFGTCFSAETQTFSVDTAKTMIVKLINFESREFRVDWMKESL